MIRVIALLVFLGAGCTSLEIEQVNIYVTPPYEEAAIDPGTVNSEKKESAVTKMLRNIFK